MSGQLLLLLLTSVLASDDSSLNGAEKQQTHVSQVDMFSASVAEDCKSKKKAVPQLSETQKSMMNHLELADNWTFWYQDDSDQDSSRDTLSSEEWIQTLQKMESFRNYGQFLNQVKTFKTKIPLRIYLFKNNIRPLWEDEPNKDGGRLLICLPEERDPARAFESFLKVAVKVMCSDVGARVNGATFAYRPECGATTISVWTPLVWTPQRNKEEFNRFKRLVYEENNNSSSLKILFRPHKTYSVNPKGNSVPATTSSARRPHRQQGSIRPPPGFEGSALSGQWRFPNHSEVEKAAPVIEEDLEAKKSLELAKQKAEEEALRQKQAEEEALRKQQEEEEERQRILLLEQQRKEKEEARARKLARRQRQKENRKKRKASSRSDTSSDEEEDMSEEEVIESIAAPVVASPIEEVEAPIAPVVASPSAGYSRYLLPALATLSTVVLAGVPLAFQYLA